MTTTRVAIAGATGRMGTALLERLGHEPSFELSEDSRTARARCACRVEREIAFAGDSTLERMARFEGQGSHRFEERATLATDFVKGKDGWIIAQATLA